MNKEQCTRPILLNFNWSSCHKWTKKCNPIKMYLGYCMSNSWWYKNFYSVRKTCYNWKKLKNIYNKANSNQSILLSQFLSFEYLLTFDKERYVTILFTWCCKCTWYKFMLEQFSFILFEKKSMTSWKGNLIKLSL